MKFLQESNELGGNIVH